MTKVRSDGLPAGLGVTRSPSSDHQGQAADSGAQPRAVSSAESRAVQRDAPRDVPRAGPRAVPRAVPRVALYGTTDEQPAWADLVHFEWIPDRSSLFGWEIDPHIHDGLIQVLYPTQGGGEAVIDGERWFLEPPCLIVAPARSVHGFRFTASVDGPVITAAQKPLESLAAVAAPDLLAHIRRPAVLAVDAGSRQADALMPLFEAIAREAQTHARGQAVAGMALLLALFVQIARVARLNEEALDQREAGGSMTALAPRTGTGTVATVEGNDAAGTGRGPASPGPGQVGSRTAERGTRSRKASQIERFRGLLDARFRERLPVEGYAAELGITAGQLTRLCHEILGMSTQEVINARVVHEAQRELIYSSLSIKQVAGELGFEDEAYFGRFFRKQTGYRPTEFRQMARSRLAG